METFLFSLINYFCNTKLGYVWPYPGPRVRAAEATGWDLISRNLLKRLVLIQYGGIATQIPGLFYFGNSTSCSSYVINRSVLISRISHIISAVRKSYAGNSILELFE